MTRAIDRASAVAALRAGLRPDLALIDLGLPPVAHLPNEGFKQAHRRPPRSFTADTHLVLTGQNEESNARRARALGALELVPKPCEPDRLSQILSKALRSGGFERRDDAEDVRALIGDSPRIAQAAQPDRPLRGLAFPALVEGESGSGKERVAYSLHHLSHARKSRHLALNCAAISPALVEPTLFGYAKGAFTGAQAAKSGYFEDAADGTLFLDEIGSFLANCRRSCCASWKTANSSAWAKRRRACRERASSPQPIATFARRSSRGASLGSLSPALGLHPGRAAAA